MTTKKFEDLFNFAKKSRIKAGEGMEKGLYPFYTSSPILSKSINKAQIKEEALIFGTGGQPSIHYSKEPFSASTDCIVALPKKTKNINPKFVYYYIFGSSHILERGFKGAGLKHISKKYIKNLDIPVFQIESQNKIVTVLDKASHLVKKRQQIINLLDELILAQFFKIFGDPTRPNRFKLTNLQTYIEKIQIGPFGSQLHSSDYIIDGIPLINPTNIVDKKVVPDSEKTISKSKFNSLPKYHLKTGDIIMARRGEMGRCSIITEKENGWFCGTGSLFIRPKDINKSSFLLYCLTNIGTVKYLNHNAKGVTMKNLTKSIVSNIPIIDCPEELCLRFNKTFLQYKKIKAKLLENLIAVEKLFNSTLQRAFKNQLNFNVTIELDAIIQGIDIEIKENDIKSIATDIAYLQNLVDRLNEQDFETQALYFKAKHAAFQLLKEDERIKQVFNEANKSLKLAVK